jgi:hypothetical protein
MWELGREFERARHRDAFAAGWAAAAELVDQAVTAALERTVHGAELDAAAVAAARDIYRRYLGLALGATTEGDTCERTEARTEPAADPPAGVGRGDRRGGHADRPVNGGRPGRGPRVVAGAVRGDGG